MSARVDAQPVYVLHLRPYRDSSAIIDVLSRDYGRLSVIAKGLRGAAKSRQQWRGALQLGNSLHIGWRGRSELKTLVDAQLHSHFPLQGDALYCAFYLNELLERLLHPLDPQSDLFELYGRCLLALSSGQPIEPVLRRFELAMLEVLGYGIDFSAVGDDPQSRYIYDCEQGFCPAPQTLSAQVTVYPAGVLMRLAGGELDTQTLPLAKRLCRQALAPLLGDRPLHSRKLFLSKKP